MRVAIRLFLSRQMFRPASSRLERYLLPRLMGIMIVPSEQAKKFCILPHDLSTY